MATTYRTKSLDPYGFRWQKLAFGGGLVTSSQSRYSKMAGEPLYGGVARLYYAAGRGAPKTIGGPASQSYYRQDFMHHIAIWRALGPAVAYMYAVKIDDVHGLNNALRAHGLPPMTKKRADAMLQVSGGVEGIRARMEPVLAYLDQRFRDLKARRAAAARPPNPFAAHAGRPMPRPPVRLVVPPHLKRERVSPGFRFIEAEKRMRPAAFRLKRTHHEPSYRLPGDAFRFRATSPEAQKRMRPAPISPPRRPKRNKERRSPPSTPKATKLQAILGQEGNYA